MDAVSEMLRVVTLESAIYFNAEFSEPWLLGSPQSSMLAPMFSTEAVHVIVFHLLCEGTAYVELEDGSHVVLVAGDLLALPQGDQHVLGAGPRVRPIQTGDVLPSLLGRKLDLLQLGGGGQCARFICGYLVCDRNLGAALFSGLPKIIRINLRTDASGQWLENSLRFAVTEANASSPGANAMLTKLSDVAFAETLRRHVQDLPPDQTGWLAGARDAAVGKALSLIHQRPADPWTVAELARDAGVSRTVLAERFRHFLDETPMAYLTRWRLLLGARALAGTNHGVAKIAADVGYESEAAFNRAFKRSYGQPPARYRKDKTSGA